MKLTENQIKMLKIGIPVIIVLVFIFISVVVVSKSKKAAPTTEKFIQSMTPWSALSAAFGSTRKANVNPAKDIASSLTDEQRATLANSIGQAKANTTSLDDISANFGQATPWGNISANFGQANVISEQDMSSRRSSDSAIMIVGKKGVITIRDVNAFITGKGSNQNDAGCYSLDAFQEWRDKLKDGNKCAVQGIKLPVGIKAMAYTSNSWWDNICSQTKVGPDLSGGKYHDLSNLNVCGFKFMKT